MILPTLIHAFQVWDGLEYEGPLAKDALTCVELPHQNIGDQGLWFLFSLLELTRPLLLSMDLSFNCISSQGTKHRCYMLDYCHTKQ